MATLNAIDISSHQTGLNLETIFARNPIHGVIVKATQGTSYVNPVCDPWVQWLIKNNKPWGFYHYMSGSQASAKAEAQYFYKHCVNYFGAGVPVCDLEGSAINRGPTYLKEFLDEVYALSGVKPMVYMQLSAVQSYKDGLLSTVNAGYKLWLAQYASATAKVYGFKEKPWQSGSVYPFDKITMHQYSDHGVLDGWSGDLDLDIFYGDENDFRQLAKKDSSPAPDPEPIPEPEPDPTPEEDWLQMWIDFEQAEASRHLAKAAELKAQKEARKR